MGYAGYRLQLLKRLAKHPKNDCVVSAAAQLSPLTVRNAKKCQFLKERKTIFFKETLQNVTP